MLTQVWKKYLPVIAILIKKSAKEQQSLSLDQADFQRATGGRKVKFVFSDLQINKGLFLLKAAHSTHAKEFVAILQESEITRPLIRERKLEFSLTSGYELIINDLGANAEPEHEPEA